MGPTASGKTGLALELAERLPSEIVSVDSALVYRHMDIGTAKPDPATRARVPHHLIDILDPTESYSAGQFVQDALRVMSEITARGRIPLLAGGTMLYFKAIQHGLDALPPAEPRVRAEIERRAQSQGWAALHAQLARLDPATGARIRPSDPQRIQRALEVIRLTGAPLSEALGKTRSSLPYRFVSIALVPQNRALLHARIARRFEQMLERGLIDEVRALRSRFELNRELPSMRCVGYRQVSQFLEGELDYAALEEKAIAATRQLAKRQMTWLRAMPEAKVFDCFAPDLTDVVFEHVRTSLSVEIAGHA
jgi:tRNA dimethylallyltransferase